MSYVISGKTVNEHDPSEVQKKIMKKYEEAINNNDYKTHKIGRKEIKCYRAELPLALLYYNLENDRTLVHCEEYIEDNNKPEDYFSRSNFANAEQQEAYHRIILKFVKDVMKKEFEDGFQRDRIYITTTGIIVNGNTRVACWRENDQLAGTVEVLICPEDMKDDWPRLRDMIDAQDNAIDIGSEYPWYNRAERLMRNIKMYDNEEEGLKDTWKRQQFKTLGEAQAFKQMYKYAEEMIASSSKYPQAKYKRRSDMGEEGDKSGCRQALRTLHNCIEKENKRERDFAYIQDTKEKAYEIIQTGEKGSSGSIHKCIEGIFTRPAFELYEDGRDAFDENNQQNESYIHDLPLKEFLVEVEQQNQISVDTSRKDRSKKALEKAIKNMEAASSNLSPESNTAGMDEMLSEMEEEIKKFKDALSRL